MLAVTFSVKAAAEMRARLEQLGLQGGTSGVAAATFHSAALRQLNSVWADVCEAPFPHLIEDQRDTVSRAITRATAVRDIDALTVRDVLAEINWAKISLVPIDDYARISVEANRQPPAGFDAARFAAIYDAYEQEKTSRGEIDLTTSCCWYATSWMIFPKRRRRFVPPSAGSPLMSIRMFLRCSIVC